jgi:ribose transport system permease protein
MSAGAAAAPEGRGVAQALAALPGAVHLLVALSVGLALATPHFLTATNLVHVALQAAVLLIVALGMTLVILTEGIDLSVGPVLGLCGVVMAQLLIGGVPIPLALAAGALIGVGFGVLNGVLVAVAGLPPFIATLGSFGVAQSLAMVLTGGGSVTGLPPVARWFNEGVLLGLPVPVWATAAVFGLTWALLYHTRFGRYVFAIGGNRRALELTGTRVRLCHTLVYAYSGLLAALAAVIMTARMNAAHPTIGVGLEFDAIAAVILGGTSFEKGRGGIAGTVVGALAVGVLRNGLNLLGVGSEWQVAIVGAVIIAAVGVDSLRGAGA